MIRVLQCVNNMHRAGLETMLMNYYRNMDRTKIQFDFLTHRPEKSDYDDEIIAMGGRVYYAPRLYPQNYPAYFAYMKRFFAEHPEYRIVHSHIDAMSYIPLFAAKRAKIPVRIAHSHNTAIDKDIKYILKQCFRYCIPSVANYRLACGQEAGEFLFRGRTFEVVPNAIEASSFVYSADIRNRIRKEMQLDEKFVIGHIGRFSYAKNQVFLIDIFSEIRKHEPDSILLLIGKGEKEKEARNRVEELGLSKQVHFLGSRNDVQNLYQAMDAFVLPSLFEGVPVVGIEAQYAGLPCFFSDKVSDEVVFTDQCTFIGLERTKEEWAEQIIAAKGKERKIISTTNTRYDIAYAKEKLEEFYIRNCPI
ncbi:MAG: glycosyltransferase family 1 protein [Clostridia bacterium]|nr:glycosyltransferase family 1 protein [Clostridia bacterium]